MEEIYRIVVFIILMGCSVGFVLWYDPRKYSKNTPYSAKKKIGHYISRFLLGLLAGVHYLFFIGTYSHKKYNTQVDNPETFECHVAVYFMTFIILGNIVFLNSLVSLFGSVAYYIWSIPLLTNLISVFFDKSSMKK